MQFITFLLGFPVVAAILMALIRADGLRGLWIRTSALLVAAGSVALAAEFFQTPPQFFTLEEHTAHQWDRGFMIAGILLSALLLYCCRRIEKKEWYIPVLILLQTGVILAVELKGGHVKVDHPLYVDSFSSLMALIIGIVGGLICVHAVRYMRVYHAHEHGAPDRRGSFFLVFFAFLSAMFGIVFSNHLLWLFFFWEVTTFCSFWLISYPQTPEAIRNGYRALGINALGGLFFAGAIAWMVFNPNQALRILELDKLVAGKTLFLVPAVFIAVAGLTKSAQMPFSSWLLGAMVAPTPVSAMLHSSTMVKAGVFILVKLAPVYHGTIAGFLLALVGASTFVVTSLVAVNQTNAKRVLAYSTIANLGLIVMCAGVETSITLWAALLLILFHAVAKALLFLGTGTTEHLIGSRNIEDMSGLVYRRPMLAILMMLGILGMFLAPFGMLISKYTCFKAFLTMQGASPLGGVLLTCVLAFGSAPTLFFWSKWLGKLVARPAEPRRLQEKIPLDEAVALVGLGILSYLACALFPLVDWAFIEPYIKSLVQAGLVQEMAEKTPLETVVVMLAMLLGLFLLPLFYWIRPPRYTAVSTYLAGANVNSGSASYQGAMGEERIVTTPNYYLTMFINEGKLTVAAVIVSVITIALMLGASFAP